MRLKTGQVVSADLVVDASGGNSRVGKWLEQIGHPTPPTMSVDAGLQYTCCMYEFPEDPSRDWQMAMCMDNPELTSVNVILPIEHNRWQVKAHSPMLQSRCFDAWTTGVLMPKISRQVLN